MPSRTKTFQAILERGGMGLGWTIARVPFEPKELGEMIRLRVAGEIAASPKGPGFAFRNSLFSDPRGGFFLLVTRAMQSAAGVQAGGAACIRLRADPDPRPAELPDELAALLDEEPGLRAWYDALSESMRREIGKWIGLVKTDQARLKRSEQMAERLLLAMEGERQLPPIVERAFRQRPKARAGWAKLTDVQRRQELLGVFYYRTPEAQERRVEKLCDNAEKRAGV